MQLVELRSHSLWQTIRNLTIGAPRADLPLGPHPHAMLLQAQGGRGELIDALAPAPGSRVVELGAGNGTMLDAWGSRLNTLGALELVESAPAMVAQARYRARRHRHIRVVQADAASYRAPWLADCVYLAYALTQIPDWVRVLHSALAMLKPGGKLGVVDYYVSGHDRTDARVRHTTLTQWFWTHWFAQEHAHLSADHLAALCTLTERARLLEARRTLPYLPLLKAPYYVFVGVKRARPSVGLIAELWKKSAKRS